MTWPEVLASRSPWSPPDEGALGSPIPAVRPARPVQDLLSRLDGAGRGTLLDIVVIVGRLAPDAVEAVCCDVPSFVVEAAPLIGVVAGPRGLWLVPFSSAVLDAVRPELPEFTVSRCRVRLTGHQQVPRRVLTRLVSLRRAEIHGATAPAWLDVQRPHANLV
jgi:hypothetical protein